MKPPLSGRVVDALGGPVAAAAVMVAGGTAPTPEIAIRTDAEGRFRLALPAGTFRVVAHAADGRRGEIEVTRSDASDPDLSITIAELGDSNI